MLRFLANLFNRRPKPDPNAEIYTVVKGDTLFSISSRFDVTVERIMRLNNLLDARIQIGQTLRLRQAEPPAPAPITHSSTPGGTQTYRVVAGDTLFGIARRFNTSVDEIRRLNNLRSDQLSIGQSLLVPGAAAPPTPAPTPPPPAPPPASGGTQTYRVVAGDTLFGIARRFNTSVDEIRRLNNLRSDQLSIGQSLLVPGAAAPPTPAPTPPPPAPPPASGGTQTYRVVAGDTLFGIARRFNTSVDEIRRLNNLRSDQLSIGQSLLVPGAAAPAPPVAPLPPSPVPAPAPQTPPPTPFDYMAARRAFQVEIRQENGFRRYFLRVPLVNGSVINAVMRDNIINSRHMVYPHGIMYVGQSKIELDLPTVQSVGLTWAQARALQYVSTHEGCFDAINSYDKAIFSYGFIQFAAAANVGASLNDLLNSMRQHAPEAFNRTFGRVGIGAEGGGVSVLDDHGGTLRGDQAWLYIQRNVQIYGAFVQAGFETSLIREQLRMANVLYVQPALNFRLDLSIGGINIRIPRLQDILNSEAMLTAVIAIAINRGNGGMSRIVTDAVSAVAQRDRLHTEQALRNIDERSVCLHIAATHDDDRVRNRAQGVIDAGLSFAKV